MAFVVSFSLYYALAQTAKSPPSNSAAHFIAKLKGGGKFDCFPKGLSRKRGKKRGKPVYCETSAAAYAGGLLWFASDKKIPGANRSSVFTMPHQADMQSLSNAAPNYKLHPNWRSTKKIEDLAVSPDGRYLLATSAFDRFLPQNTKWDKFNRLLYHRVGDQEVNLFRESQRKPDTNSIPLRSCLARALANKEYPSGVPYFKIEGLAIIPGQRILFGVREWGAHYRTFEYSVKIISASYQLDAHQFSLQGDCHLVYDFSLRAAQKIGRKLGLSSLEYNRHDGLLYMLTSFEEDDPNSPKLGAYLWRLSLPDLHQNRPATLARLPNGQPLRFDHKAEGLAIIDPHTLLIIHDDDRVMHKHSTRATHTKSPMIQGKSDIQANTATKIFGREPHQAAYHFIELVRRDVSQNAPAKMRSANN
jgi:hypothetical protein